ncbi:MAG: hypothetical protein P4L46_07750 [Fimbriimonas sp.]|nr:hypothetical protein [Fimbriimonas sp.]
MSFVAAILGAYLLGPSLAMLRLGSTELVVRGKTFVSTNGYDFDGGSLTGTGRELVLENGGRREKIDLRAIEKAWFEDDARWGGHEECTRLRHIAFGQGEGFDTYISDFAPVGPGKALAILSLDESARMAQPRAQVLVTLSASPLRIKWIRRLSSMGDGQSLGPARRLYRFRKRLYLNDSNQISRVDSSGIAIKKICAWSIESLPLGLAGDRWVISESTDVTNRTLEATDLSTGEYRVLFSPANSSYPIESNQPYRLDSLFGPYVLFSYAPRVIGNTMCWKFLSIRVPDGAFHAIPGIYPTLEPFGPYLAGQAPGSTARIFFKNGKEVDPKKVQPFRRRSR